MLQMCTCTALPRPFPLQVPVDVSTVAFVTLATLRLEAGQLLPVEPGFASLLRCQSGQLRLSHAFSSLVFFLSLSSETLTHQRRHTEFTFPENMLLQAFIKNLTTCFINTNTTCIYIWTCPGNTPPLTWGCLDRDFCNPHGLNGEAIVTGLEQCSKIKLRHKTFRRWNPRGKRSNSVFPNFSPHRRDAVQLRLYHCITDLGERVGPGIVFSRHTGHRAEEKHPAWEGGCGRPLSPGKF